MNGIRWQSVAQCFLMACLVNAPAHAQQAQAAGKPSSPQAETKAPPAAPSGTRDQPKIRFKPPTGIGAASNAVAGGTRGNARELVLFVAAPNQLGLTATGRPDLYWYVSRALSVAPDFMLVEVGGTQPLVERKLSLPTGAGFQRISLSELGVELQEGREYLWQISLGSGSPAGNMLDASGRIRRLAAPADLAGRVAGNDALMAAAAYADAGYWYDAVMRLRDNAGRSGGFSEPEISLFDSAGLGQLIRRATDSSN
jgi:Domain of Unknown Function (DUF928)